MLKTILKATNAQKLSKQDLQKINGGTNFQDCRFAGDSCVIVYNSPILGRIEQEGICQANGLCLPNY